MRSPALLISWLAVSPAALAQDVAGPVASAPFVTSVPSQETGSTAPSGLPCHILNGTVVQVGTVESLSSRNARRGDTFKLRLHVPIMAGDITIVPAGTEGSGEVIHAQRASGGGKAGELLLAARHIDHNGVHFPLRGMKLARNGKDNSTLSAVLASTISVLALAVKGGDIEIPAGSLATAKIAADIDTSSTCGLSASTMPSEAVSPQTFGPEPSATFHQE